MAVATAGLLHILGVMLVLAAASGRNIPTRGALTSPEVMRVILPPLVFRPSAPTDGRGGGGVETGSTVRFGMRRQSDTMRLHYEPHKSP